MKGRHSSILWPMFASFVLAAMLSSNVLAVQDVLLQTMDGKIVTGIVDDQTGEGTLGTRVYRRSFLSNYRASDPGFFGLATGNPNLPPGAAGFPANHNVNFDLLPMEIGDNSSNLFYWDGSDSGGNGLDSADVQFVPPPAVDWEVFDANFSLFVADGTSQFVPGGLIQKTSADVDPSDGIDTGAIHKHLVLQLNDNDGNPDTTPPAGVYMIAWQIRSAGFETSDPLVFVHRTSTVADAVRDLAADWAIAHIDALFPPALPGDYNDDQVVNAADYTVWRNSLGAAIALPNENASQNVIDAADYEVWKTHYGEMPISMAGGATGDLAPEPSTTLLSLSAILAALACPRRHRAATERHADENQRRGLGHLDCRTRAEASRRFAEVGLPVVVIAVVDDFRRKIMRQRPVGSEHVPPHGVVRCVDDVVVVVVAEEFSAFVNQQIGFETIVTIRLNLPRARRHAQCSSITVAAWIRIRRLEWNDIQAAGGAHHRIRKDIIGIHRDLERVEVERYEGGSRRRDLSCAHRRITQRHVGNATCRTVNRQYRAIGGKRQSREIDLDPAQSSAATCRKCLREFL